MTEIETTPTAPAPTRLQADGRPIILTVTWLVGLLALASFAAGVPGLVAVGRWALLPGPMAFLVPVLLDGGILVMSLVATVNRARGDRSAFAWSVLGALTLASMGAQIAHVLSEPSAGPWTAIAGAALAASFPALVFGSTHALLQIALAPAPAKRNARRAKATSKAVPAPAAARKRPVMREPEAVGPAPLRAVRTPAHGVPAVVDADREARRERVRELRDAGRSFSQISVETGIPASTAKRLAAAA
ncbi:hypothetical protein [Sanguibacter sp. Leaf3]|uniref:hypothetical protein n=1 Tax=Sanguibacter sp. Leaf3 TaxID=1736209 RepID=UPI0006FDC604|nr:hypothetical protein [Sanguibacter sp. Leaf3]KQT98365.1 hypothetical protein ASG53_11940 [Sanguibacter sp. Leaf3]